jgi:hypothetical protein
MPNTAWGAGPMAALDTEGTGLNPRTSRLIALALIEVDLDGSRLPEDDDALGGLDTIIRPEMMGNLRVSQAGVEIHGITTQRIHELGFPQRWAMEILLRRGRELEQARVPIVCFNVPYHWTMLLAELRRCGFDWATATEDHHPFFIDPLVIDRYLYPNQMAGARRLGAMAYRYGVSRPQPYPCSRCTPREPDGFTSCGDHHTKWATDALLAARIARAQYRQMVDQGFTGAWRDPGPMMEWQRRVHEGRMRDLRDYFIRGGRYGDAADVNLGWPVMHLPEGSNNVG